VIGGAGLGHGLGLGLEDAQDIAVNSPFGPPSGPVTIGALGGVRFTFLARHGEGHRLAPGAVNYRANIDVLKRCGVTDIVAFSAVAPLSGDVRSGDVRAGQFVAVDQIVDQTQGRARSFFGEGMVAHVLLHDPVCSRMTSLAAAAVEATGANVRRGGCYVAVEGPQWPTGAESRLFHSWGGDVVGMTAMPEARLAREAELPYALLAMIAGPDGAASDARETGADLACAALRHLAASLPARREPSPIDTALDGAILTMPGSRDPGLLARLDAVAGRLLKS